MDRQKIVELKAKREKKKVNLYIYFLIIPSIIYPIFKGSGNGDWGVEEVEIGNECEYARRNGEDGWIKSNENMAKLAKISPDVIQIEITLFILLKKMTFI
jgi:hypothetical protein